MPCRRRGGVPGASAPPGGNSMELILASRSPRRQALLRQMGINRFQICPVDGEEIQDPALAPAEQVEALALAKGREALRFASEDSLVLAADTLVALDGTVLGKPRDEADAAGMLAALSGRTHQVYTGVAVLSCGGEAVSHACTQVSFRVLTVDEITRYIATGEPMDKAGAYGIQGRGGLLVKGIQGDFYNVVGLPLCLTAEMLGRFGYSWEG